MNVATKKWYQLKGWGALQSSNHMMDSELFLHNSSDMLNETSRISSELHAPKKPRDYFHTEIPTSPLDDATDDSSFEDSGRSQRNVSEDNSFENSSSNDTEFKISQVLDRLQKLRSAYSALCLPRIGSISTEDGKHFSIGDTVEGLFVYLEKNQGSGNSDESTSCTISVRGHLFNPNAKQLVSSETFSSLLRQAAIRCPLASTYYSLATERFNCFSSLSHQDMYQQLLTLEPLLSQTTQLNFSVCRNSLFILL